MMQNGSDVANEPITVWLTLESRSDAGILEAQAAIARVEGVSVIEVERLGQLSQRSRLAATSASAVSLLAFSVAEIGTIVEVRVHRCCSDLSESQARDGYDAHH